MVTTMINKQAAAEEAHLRNLATQPGWHKYITDKAKKLAKQEPDIYGHLPQVVADAIAENTQPPRRTK